MSAPSRVVNLTQLEDDFVACRDFRHAWDEKKVRGQVVMYTPAEASRSRRVLQRSAPCLRCGTKRVERINLNTFETMTRHYEYPDKYLLDGKRAGSSEVRRESVRRFMPKALQETKRGKG